MEDSKLHGGCLCGLVRYEIAASLGTTEHCHCSMCRKAHGAAFSTNSLVAADALTSVQLPALVRRGVDSGINAGNTTVLWWTAVFGAGVVLLGWLVVSGQAVLTARVGETLLYLLRVRSYAHLQRLGLDYYERELAGRIMTRMTTDVDALSTFVQTGLARLVRAQQEIEKDVRLLSRRPIGCDEVVAVGELTCIVDCLDPAIV